MISIILYLDNILSIMGKYSIQILPAESLKKTADKLRVLRKAAKLSQQELAERSGVSFGSVKRFENTGKISIESFYKLLHILGRLTEFDSILQPDEDHSEIELLFSDKTRK